MMFYWVSLLGVIYFTTISACLGLCNLCRLENVITSQSSSYILLIRNKTFTSRQAIDGKFQNHWRNCAGTGVDETYNEAWWKITLPDLANIYKINLMFREKTTRHYGYYVFINNQEIDIEGLTSLTPVYHEENEEHPGVQNIIMFPGGIQGKQMYIYQNKSNPINDIHDLKNNVLDICEVEIWGCLDQNGNEMNCSCSQNENFTVLPQETLTSVVAWTSINNPLTLKCDQGSVILQQSKHQCDFKPKCVLRYTNKSVLFFCSNCTEPIHNTTTTELQQPRPIYTLSVGDNVTYVCKKGHRLVAGNLTRICQENGSWSGVEPICKPCTVATFNASTTDAQYFQPNGTLDVGDNVTYTCKRGHRLAAGNLTRICQENGSWSGEEPICKPCTVATFNARTTDAQYFQPNGTLDVGDNVTYTCKRGHRLAAGNLTRICQENGSWSGEEPICKPCTVATFNASTTDAEYFQPNDTLNVGDNVTYTCKRGHRLAAGNLTRICQENGSWTGEEPYCKRCKCSCKRLASQNFIKDPIVLQQRIEKIKKFLAVNRSELSAFKRKKISSYDGRASSTGIGMALGVGVITFVIGAIVCSDLLTCRARRGRRAPRKA
ncbi:uncharacterized protein LOC128173494 isoform X2 [Crassostrea angulata]|uniref:uncharacterized protein LOC128173494 isoform X2 n=1 Tax=Magallana angulata TaxID=2784310 RepID=UPI0022B210E7|nr:uncharacterized protein LOC128173494 isoform X2 [Crassostrea angulata]